jgi:16S rRNA (guanine527-N7)-methyltransferase
LVEPRRLRVEFLEKCVSALGLSGQVTVHQAKAERIGGRFDSITARAVASADQVLSISAHRAHSGTRWVLPKGKTAQSELAEVQRNWQCGARVEASLTDPNSAILLLDKVRAKGKR